MIKPILIWQNKESFEEYLPLLALLLLGVALMNYSLAEHFKLYIYNRDKKILRILLITNIVSIPLTVVLTYFFELYGAALAFLITGILMTYLRNLAAKKINFIYD